MTISIEGLNEVHGMKCLELTIPPLPQLTTVGHSFWEPGDCHFERTFPVYDVILVKQGRLFMMEENTPYEIGPGHMLTLEPGKTHHGYAPCAERTEIYWLHLVHAPASRTLDSRDIPWSVVLPRGTDRDLAPHPQAFYMPKYGSVDFLRLQPYLDEMLQRHRSMTAGQALPLQALLAGLLAQLQEQLQGRTRSRSAELAEQVVAYLRMHWAEPFEAERLEHELHFQFDYVSRCLKKHTGMTPLQYVQHIRLTHAVTLLEQTTLPILDIAERCGIPDGSYFIRLFRQRTGKTPKQYRLDYQERL